MKRSWSGSHWQRIPSFSAGFEEFVDCGECPEGRGMAHITWRPNPDPGHQNCIYLFLTLPVKEVFVPSNSILGLCSRKLHVGQSIIWDLL